MAVWKDFALTHTGNVRNNNEDAFACHPELGLWLVADGMGGHEAGEVASAIAIETIVEQVRQGRDLTDAILAAHHNILSSSHTERGAKGMGTTVVALQTQGARYRVAWVGDSRAYLWTKTSENTGILEQLTTDHSYVQMLVAAGTISMQEALSHKDKNVITQCLGSMDNEQIRVDTVEREWQANQWILLCSDGLSDELSFEKISARLNSQHDIETAARKLLDETLAQGGRDNATIVLVGKNQTASHKLLDRFHQWLSSKH